MNRNNFLLKKFGSFNFFTYLCNMNKPMFTEAQIKEYLLEIIQKRNKIKERKIILYTSIKNYEKIKKEWSDIIEISLIKYFDESTN